MNKATTLALTAAFSLFLFASPAIADVRLPALIGDNMVLLQNTDIPLWGWAEPGETITVSYGPCSRVWTTTADQNGKWMVETGPFEAGPAYTMTIKGTNTIYLKNVIVGEVWLCSGQSNMEMPVNRLGGWRTGAKDYLDEIASADYPQIRLFTVKKTVADTPQADCTGAWVVCTPETVGDFSAAAYFFGRNLHKNLNVPVGLIQSCWGGTVAEAWTSKKTLQADEDFAPILERFDHKLQEYKAKTADYQHQLEQWKEAVGTGRNDSNQPPQKPEPPKHPRGRNSPASLYNAMIAPLIPYAVRGAIWYQGESNAGRAYQYRKLFPAMIQNWRKDWGRGDFPFYYVQIAPFRYGTKFIAAELREAQLMALSVPNTAMVVTTDIGDPNDIHPRNKQEVGRRLALCALAETYGRGDTVCSGPIYKSMKIETGRIRIFFEHVNGGLVAKGGPLTHFEIAGENREFLPAQAVIDGETVVVSCKKVHHPVAVRFGWSNTAEPNLFNKAGLPASAFRTDDWPRITEDKR